jgi:acyl carrier protein
MNETSNGRRVSASEVREFLVHRYSKEMRHAGIDPAEVRDDFDFLISGVVDSFGVMEMITAIEDAFSVQIDLATLDAEHVTVLWSLSRHIADNSGRTS